MSKRGSVNVVFRLVLEGSLKAARVVKMLLFASRPVKLSNSKRRVRLE
jgi:hypothetical protein